MKPLLTKHCWVSSYGGRGRSVISFGEALLVLNMWKSGVVGLPYLCIGVAFRKKIKGVGRNFLY